MQNQLAQSHVGRILLHLACACIDQKYAWHWHGACRELALPASGVPNKAPTRVADIPAMSQSGTEFRMYGR